MWDKVINESCWLCWRGENQPENINFKHIGTWDGIVLTIICSIYNFIFISYKIFLYSLQLRGAYFEHFLDRLALFTYEKVGQSLHIDYIWRIWRRSFFDAKYINLWGYWKSMSLWPPPVMSHFVVFGHEPPPPSSHLTKWQTLDLKISRNKMWTFRQTFSEMSIFYS